MNQNELGQLIIGTLIIVLAFAGFTMFIDHAATNSQAQGWFAMDFYTDHHHNIPPTPTSPTPTDTPAPVSTTISPDSGGTLRSNDEAASLTLQFPAGAVSETTVITYAYQLPGTPAPGLVGADRFFELNADQGGTPVTTFNRPVSVSITMPPDSVIISGTAGLYRLDGSEWVTDGITLTHSSDQEVDAYLNHFSLFAVLGDTHRGYLPLVMREVPYYVITRVRKLTACENMGNHHIYITVRDTGGAGMAGVPVRVSWGSLPGDGVVGKTGPNGRMEFAMSKGTYSVAIDGGNSQTASGITAGYQVDEFCGDTLGNFLYHASFEVVFQQR